VLSDSSYFPILLTGISSTISQADYAMSLWAGTTTEESQRMYKRILGYKLMDGALLISAVDGDPLPQRLLERRMPFVIIGHNSTIPEISTVDVDNLQAARDATEYLIRQGKRRIAHITGRMNLISARERFRAYREALENNGIEYDPELVIEGDWTEATGYAAGSKLVPLGIDGAFTSNDLMAVGLTRAVLEQGLSVPRDVSIIGFDDLPIASTFMPSLTTVRQPVRDLGVVATKILLGMIEGTITEPQHVVLPTELVIRET
jgi:LacI family transcriptional regulator